MIHSGIEANYTLPDDTYFFEAMPLTASATLMLFAGNLERVACPNIHTSQASDDD